MDELEKKVPADAWQKLFNEAAEVPPPRVWDAIEHRLDESASTKIIPLWGTGLAASRSALWGMGLAAALALLLVGWWAIPAPTLRSPSSLSNQRQTAMASPSPESNKPANTPSGKAWKHHTLAADVPSISTTLQTGKTMDRTLRAGLSAQKNNVGHLPIQSARATAFSVSPETLNELLTAANALSDQARASHLTAASFVGKDQALPDNDQAVPIHFLTGKPIHLHEFGRIYRIVWFPHSEQPARSGSEHKNREFWASASMMPGAFNPMVSVQTAAAVLPSATTNAALANNTAYQTPSVYSHTNFSVACQLSAGMLLNERWALETGVGYLAGRSMVDTPAQLPANSFKATAGQQASAGNLYVNALQSSIATTTSQDQANYSGAISTGYYTDQNRKRITNDYQFVQVPVQVSYQLRPRKRLNLALLGGIISNIFIRNTVDNELVVTAKDGIYRPVSFAALVGARFRYQYSGQWSASLAGIYQPSIGLITQAHSQVQSQPNTAGMTLGVDYHF